MNTSQVIYLPLENMDSRYTVMMNNSIIKEMKNFCRKDDCYIPYRIVFPTEQNLVIESGQFLDVNKTIEFKAKQLAEVSQLFSAGQITEGTLFIVADVFFPGLESIKYMAELSGIEVSIFAFNHAGRADSSDFVQKLSDWSNYSETAWHAICDRVYVGSQKHLKNVSKFLSKMRQTHQVVKFENRTNFKTSKIVSIVDNGIIWDLDYMDTILSNEDALSQKEDFIIWPHRICPEKGYLEMLAMAATTDTKVLVTSSGAFSGQQQELLDHHLDITPKNVVFKENLSKREYFAYMKKAKWYLSTARQENFGYTLQEAIYYRCRVLAPNSACYPDFLSEENLYFLSASPWQNFNHAVFEINMMQLLEHSIVPAFEITEKYHNNAKALFWGLEKNNV